MDRSLTMSLASLKNIFKMSTLCTKVSMKEFIDNTIFIYIYLI